MTPARHLVGAVVLLTGLASGSARADEPASPYAGDEVCAVCHEEQAAAHVRTAHGKALGNPSRPPTERGCEGCHGPGAAHAEAGGGRGVGGLIGFTSSTSASDRSAPCLRCHGQAHDLRAFRQSAHKSEACTGCHAMHTARAPDLLHEATPALCYRCHTDVRAQFALPENHGAGRGVDCPDCHAPHGARERAALRGNGDRTCLRCHTEVQGPFVFEHVAVVTEGCTACHVPHGSANRHLLIRQQVAQLCAECHTVTPANHLLPSYRDCTRCHVSIHGSNVDPRFLEP